MRNFKRAIALVCVVAMMMSLFAVNVFADPSDTLMIYAKADKTVIAPGESVTVSLVSDKDYTMGMMSAIIWTLDNTLTYELVDRVSKSVQLDANTAKNQLIVSLDTDVDIKAGEAFATIKITAPSDAAPLKAYSIPLAANGVKVLDTNLDKIKASSEAIDFGIKGVLNIASEPTDSIVAPGGSFTVSLVPDVDYTMGMMSAIIWTLDNTLTYELVDRVSKSVQLDANTAKNQLIISLDTDADIKAGEAFAKIKITTPSNIALGKLSLPIAPNGIKILNTDLDKIQATAQAITATVSNDPGPSPTVAPATPTPTAATYTVTAGTVTGGTLAFENTSATLGEASLAADELIVWDFNNIAAGTTYADGEKLQNSAGDELSISYKAAGTLPTITEKVPGDNYMKFTDPGANADGLTYTPADPIGGDKVILATDFLTGDAAKDTIILRAFDSNNASSANTYGSSDSRVFEVKTGAGILVCTDYFSMGASETKGKDTTVVSGIAANTWYSLKIEYTKSNNSVAVYSKAATATDYVLGGTVVLGSGTNKGPVPALALTKVNTSTRGGSADNLSIDNLMIGLGGSGPVNPTATPATPTAPPASPTVAPATATPAIATPTPTVAPATATPGPSQDPTGISAKAGDVIRVTGTPYVVGQIINSITATGVTFTKVSDNVYTFVMPAQNVVVNATFTAAPGPTPTIAPPTATPSPSTPPPTATPGGPTATPGGPTATPGGPTATPGGPTATPGEPTATPAQNFLVQINADEYVNTIELTNASTGMTYKLEKIGTTFRGYVPAGNYTVVATTSGGRELDLANSDIDIRVTDGEVDAEVKTTVESDVASITIKQAPKKTEYLEGDNFDPTGMIITVHYKDSSKPDEDVVYDNTTKSKFTFKPSLEESLPGISDSIEVIYGNRNAFQDVSFVLTNVDVNLKAPVAKAAVWFEATNRLDFSHYNVSSDVSWSPVVDTRYDYNTVYTATFTVDATGNCKFNNALGGQVVATINGKAINGSAVVSADGKTVTITHEFPATGKQNNGGGPTGGSTGNQPTATPGPVPTATATSMPGEVVFDDVPMTYWAYGYIMDLYYAGIVNGDSPRLFLPENNVTRAEFTKMAVLVFGLETKDTKSVFVDVNANDWFAPYIVAATKAAMVTGVSETEFAPNDNVTREQMAAIIGRYLSSTSDAKVKYTDEASIAEYAYKYVSGLTDQGLLTGEEDGSFRPQAPAARSEAAALLSRVKDLINIYTGPGPVIPEATATAIAE